MAYSKETIQSTLNLWQPKYDKIGVRLTEEDAREILDNVTGFFHLLFELDKKYNSEQ